VVVGLIDSEGHVDDTVQGFTSYLADGLQQLAREGSIYVSETVRRQAEGFFRFKDLGPCALPEIAQAVHVYACVGANLVNTRLEAFLRRHRSAFLGRDREIDLLHALWTKAYHAFIPLLRALLQVNDDDTPQRQRQQIHTRLHTIHPRLIEDELLLSHLLGVAVDAESLPNLSPEAWKRQLQHVCQQVILHPAAESPLCLLIEDGHWLDSGSRELLDLLVMSVSGLPILLLVTARPGFRHTWDDPHLLPSTHCGTPR
jgi:hypothetical protein